LAFLRDPAVFTAGPGRGLGDFYRLRIPATDLFVVAHPAIIEEILVNQGDKFEKSRVYWGELSRIIGEAMASVEGERWRYLRRLEQEYFTPRAASRYMPRASRITQREFDALERRSRDHLTMPALDLFAYLNTGIMLDILFDQEDREDRLEITHRIVDGENTIAWRSKFPWRPTLAHLNGMNHRARGHKAYFQALADEVEGSCPGSENHSLLTGLCTMRSNPEAPSYPHELLRNEMIVHLGASSETQGVAEAWCLYLLWQHPESLELLREEVDRVSGGEVLNTQHIPDLTYTLQVIRETLRLYPTAYGVVRDCVQDTDLCGQAVSKRQVFFISLPALHRSPRFWNEPEAFRPERFTTEATAQLHRHQYMPFGAGKHVCIGQHIALPTMTLAIALFAQRFEWRFDDPDVGSVGLATLKPSGPFKVTIRPRARA
jgi:cytochrome P450